MCRRPRPTWCQNSGIGPTNRQRKHSRSLNAHQTIQSQTTRQTKMANLKRPELKLGGNISENFKNFEVRFHDYCIQADYRNLAKNLVTERADYYKKPLLEISALRSAMPDEALQVIRYTIEPQIAADDRGKPWIWMDKLRLHYTGSIGSSLLADRFKFWHAQQSPHESVQEWEVKVRQAGSLCSYNTSTDEMCRDKFVFGLHDDTMRAELLKTHLKSDGTPKSMQDVVAEAKALESAQKANKLITDATKGIEDQVNWISHKQMKLKREPGTCFWCGDRRGPHPWKTCPANGKTCTKCGINDHFSRVCLETGPSPQQAQPRKTTQWQAQGRGRGDRTPRDRPQPVPPRKQNVHLLHTANDHLPVEYYTDDYQEQCYSLETRQIHSVRTDSAKKKYFVTLPISATGNKFIPMTFQIDTATTCNRHPSQADAKHVANKVTLPPPPLRRRPATETIGADRPPMRTKQQIRNTHLPTSAMSL